MFLTFTFLYLERLAEERRIQEEEEAAKAAEEAKKREEEAQREKVRKQREEERQAALEKQRLQDQRAEEALARRAAAKTKPATAAAVPESTDTWRRGSAPSTPIRASAATPPRPESPSAVASKYRAPVSRGDGAAGGWRAREAAKAGGGTIGTTTPPRPISPAVVDQNKPPAAQESDGFTPVASKQKWGASRLRRGGA